MSMLFNATFYLDKNPDVLLAIAQKKIASAEAHWNEFGAVEGRNPNATFDTKFYYKSNPDVLASDMNPLVHFLQNGAAEGRSPSASFVTKAQFDTVAYAAANADLATAGITTPAALYEHFAISGFSEARPGVQTTNGVAITDGVAGGAVGTTFTLTTGADTGAAFTGTASNDIFTAGYDGAATSTFNVTDSLNGGAGQGDVLNIVASDDAIVALPGALVSAIEIINVRNVDGNGTAQVLTVNAGNFTGATSLNSDRSSDSVTFAGVAAGASVGVIGNGTVVNGATVAGYAAAATAAVVNISGGTTGTGVITVTGNGLTSATINSTGAANTVGNVVGAASTTGTTINATTNLTTGAVSYVGATLTIDGAGAVNLSATALAAGVTTLNAAGNSGGVTVALGTAVTQTVTGGTGNDTITSGAVLTTGSVDAGAGTADKLILGTNVAHANTVSLAGKYTNFETLSLAGTLDASLIAGITAIEATGASVITKMSATQAAAVTVSGAAANQTFALADATGLTDVLNVKLGTGLTNAAADNMTTLTATGFETINLSTNAGPTATVGANKLSTIAAITNTSLTNLNLTGTAFNIASIASTKAVAIDGSNLTGDGAATPAGLTVAGNAISGTVVTGSAFLDTANLGTAAGATYNLGAGNDVINATAAEINAGVNYNIIDGGIGTDTLNIDGGAALALVDNNLKNVSNIENIVVATTTTNDQSITTGGFFDTQFKTAGVDLTTTATTGNITIDMTSFSGVAKVTATTAGTGGTEGAINVGTGSGADVISVTAAGAPGVVRTFAGDDSITTNGAAVFTITGGAGSDKIILSSTGINTVVFENTAALNGSDTITGFNKAVDILNWVQGDAEITITGNLTTNADDLYQLGAQVAGSADSTTAAAAAANAAATWTSAAATAWIAVSDDNSTGVYEWTDVAGTNGVQASELTLVGVVDSAMTTFDLATAFTIV